MKKFKKEIILVLPQLIASLLMLQLLFWILSCGLGVFTVNMWKVDLVVSPIVTLIVILLRRSIIRINSIDINHSSNYIKSPKKESDDSNLSSIVTGDVFQSGLPGGWDGDRSTLF